MNVLFRWIAGALSDRFHWAGSLGVLHLLTAPTARAQAHQLTASQNVLLLQPEHTSVTPAANSRQKGDCAQMAVAMHGRLVIRRAYQPDETNPTDY